MNTHFHPAPKGTPRVLTRGWKRKLQVQLLAAAYAIVNERDGNCDRVTGRRLFPRSSDPKKLRTHHHLQPRSTAPAQRADPRNIILCSQEVHALLQGDAILVDGDDANQVLRFRWNRQLVPVGREPIRIAPQQKARRTA